MVSFPLGTLPSFIAAKANKVQSHFAARRGGMRLYIFVYQPPLKPMQYPLPTEQQAEELIFFGVRSGALLCLVKKAAGNAEAISATCFAINESLGFSQRSQTQIRRIGFLRFSSAVNL